MSESLYFNLLFHKLSDAYGNINNEILELLSNSFTGFNIEQILSMHKKWKQNPQIWCFKPNILTDKSLINLPSKNVLQKVDEINNNYQNVENSDDLTMVIHVCDEPKKLNKDFHCSKMLLVSEMKYFADYLSNGSQTVEDVDISVHCDINIFEWLIKYVKRHELPEQDRVSVSALKPNNVISILISSDFLKMDKLVNDCINFICENVNNLLASSNINCVNSSLVTRIAEKFTDLEIDSIIDKKDKIKSTLIKNKIENLYDSQYCRKSFTIAPATYLFKCKYCEKILIRTFELNIKCVDSRLCVDSSGNIIYCHEINESWKLDDQLLEWVQHFRINNSSIIDASSMIYWRLWSHLNVLQCEICKDVFPLYEIGHCRYHPETPRYGKDDGRSVIPITEGMYLCCGLKTLRFDPFQVNKGCKAKDHIVRLYTNNIKYSDESSHLAGIMNVLTRHRNLFVIPFVKEPCGSDFIPNIIGRDRLIIRSKFSDSIMKLNEEIDSEVKNEAPIRPRLQPLIRPNAMKRLRKLKNNSSVNVDDLEEDIGESDYLDKDDIGLSSINDRDSPITIKTGAILLDAPQFPVFKNKKWDSNKSMRYNQDSQRQEDLRRMRQIVQYLTSLRVEIDKNPKPKLKEFIGGIYCKIEQQWRAEVNEKMALSNLITQRAISCLKTKQKPSPGVQPFK